jgi:uncharacterized protein
MMAGGAKYASPVPVAIDTFDLSSLRLEAGEGRRLELAVAVEPLELGGDSYAIDPDPLAVRVDLSRTTGGGYALALRFSATLRGPCMRCLEPAEMPVEVEAREISQPGAGEELDSPYVEQGILAIAAWTRDALALALPASLLCRPDCAGLCPVCGTDLNAAGPEHSHPREPDPRWAKLSELNLD